MCVRCRSQNAFAMVLSSILRLVMPLCTKRGVAWNSWRNRQLLRGARNQVSRILRIWLGQFAGLLVHRLLQGC